MTYIYIYVRRPGARSRRAPPENNVDKVLEFYMCTACIVSKPQASSTCGDAAVPSLPWGKAASGAVPAAGVPDAGRFAAVFVKTRFALVRWTKHAAASGRA